VIHYADNHYYYNLIGAAPRKTPQTLLNQLEHKWKTHRPNFKRGEELLRNIEQGKYGRLLNVDRLFIARLKSCFMAPDRHRAVKVAGIFGAPGSGKTYPIIERLKQVPCDKDLYRLVSPTVILRSAASRSLKLPSGHGFKAPTPETPLLGSYTPLMILDEIGKYPPGYLDLLLVACPGIKHVIVTGDPAQSVYHCGKSDNTLDRMTSEVDYLSKYAVKYLRRTTRLARNIALAMGIEYDDNDREGDFLLTNRLPKCHNLLCAADFTAQAHASFGKLTATFVGSQGLTFNAHYAILIDTNSKDADDRAWYTAITRGRFGINLVCTTWAYDKIPYHNSAIARALISRDNTALQAAIESHLAHYTPRHLLDPIALLGSGRRKTKVALACNTTNLPFLSGILDETTAPEYIKPNFDTIPTSDINLRPATFPGLYNRLHHATTAVAESIGVLTPLCRAANEREALIGDLITAQVDESAPGREMFLRHTRNDEATQNWTNKGRFKPYDGNNISKTVKSGILLHVAFNHVYQPAWPHFDPILYETYAREDQNNYLSKGFTALQNIKARADPDWFNTYAETFLKGQSITKPGTYDRAAKMGQLVISFNTIANFRFGAMARYMSYAFKAAMPPTFFMLDGKTDADMSEFVREHWDFSRDSTEDDYTAFDSTQGGEFLNFDRLIMLDAGIPEKDILDYLYFMTHLETWMGRMGLMMPSGCKFTLLFNTTRSAAYQALKYDIKRNTPIALTGDDTACNGTPRIRPIFLRNERHFKLVSKRQTARYPIFCGWRFSPVGCYKEPELLLQRTLYQHSRNNLSKCYLSYAADITPLHQNIEQLCDLLSEQQLEDHFTTLQILRTEARQQRNKLLGDFMTTYGRHRHYDLL